MLYHWVTETLLWAKSLQGPHVRCIQQSRIARVESISKGKSKSIISPHTFDWSFQYKTTVSLWVWFFQSQYGQRYQYFWFWHILLSKKGDTVTNVYSHAYWTNWQWFSMVCILINNNYPLSQWSTFAADSCSPVRWVSKNFWALWWQTSLPIRLQTTLSHYQFFFQLMQAVLPVLLSTTKIGQSDCNITADCGKKF